MTIELDHRERKIITIALYILESQLYGDELNHELENELGSTEPDEVRNIMNKLSNGTV
ncbi:MAG: hypothetical protein JSW11_00805 [Candidatus Heimdallarchaeota archaeon]|nr:MAG: hypothetical protein JSW11_00805 [Candidatus Heimdallarchaeota archaeon]